MKKKSLVLTTAILGMLISFSSCNSYKDFEDNYVDNIPTKTENGLTLHAFCWTFNQIRENLHAIKEAGFQSILTMPVQTPKSGGAAWWAFYQPLGFQVAETSSLGTKEDLRALCAEAESLGISIYSDIVFNHLANIGDDELEKDGTPKVSPKVAEYEPYIYEHRNDAGDTATFHHNKNATGSGAETQVYSFGALPDLNTANPYVQERALSLLKECIDLGIDGFRFDAAKHIETPDDPDYASDFWPNVLVPAKEYYETKNTGDDLYCYGEILGYPSGRDISVYTEYMDVTADGYAQNLTSGVITNKKASILVNGSYGKSTDANKIMTWVESHDTYADSSSHYNETRVAKMWGVIASRKDAQGLYLARPNESLEVGTVSSYQFENEYVAVSNRFHNRFIGAEEDLHAEAEDQVFVNERYSETDEGAYVLNLMAEKKEYTQTVKFNHLKNGNYYDTVTGNKVVVTNGKATIEFDVSGICILTRSKTLPRPGYTISKRGGSFVDTLNIKITAKNASKSYYFFNNDENSPVLFADETTVKVGNHVIDKQESITLVLQNGTHEVRRTFTYKLVDLIDGYFNVINLNPAYLTDYELYIWSWSPSLWHKNYTIQDGILLIDTTGYTGFLLAIFEKGYKITKTGVWDSNNVKQSSDIKGETLKQGFYDASGF